MKNKPEEDFFDFIKLKINDNKIRLNSIDCPNFVSFEPLASMNGDIFSIARKDPSSRMFNLDISFTCNLNSDDTDKIHSLLGNFLR